MRDDDNATVTTSELARLIDVTPKTIADLGKRKIIEKGTRRGSWLLQPSVRSYCAHLRAEAAARGGDAGAGARARLGSAQASLAEACAERIRGEVAPIAEVLRRRAFSLAKAFSIGLKSGL
jgi:DNA-binding XRE family transcriptional regulator